MTNRERLAQMSDEELAKEMQTFGDCAVRKYVNLEAWLSSETEEYPIRGEGVTMQSDQGESVPATLVDRQPMMGRSYCRLIIKNESHKLHEFYMVRVPAEKVHYAS
ncbi:MAG: hypothetical protein LUE86_08010 [Clostridiales bacterium]|nr:hypothetical protein [Clostridiales bacterium]